MKELSEERKKEIERKANINFEEIYAKEYEEYEKKSREVSEEELTKYLEEEAKRYERENPTPPWEREDEENKRTLEEMERKHQERLAKEQEEIRGKKEIRIDVWNQEEEEIRRYQEKQRKEKEEQEKSKSKEDMGVNTITPIFLNEWFEPDVMKNIILASKLITEDRPEIKWAVEGLLPEQGIVIIGGDSGSYKTYIALHLALSIANGLKAFNFLITKIGKVLYIDEENSLIIVIDRVYKLLQPNQRTVENLGFMLYKGVKLTNDDLWKTRLEKVIKEFKPDVVIIDSLVRVIVGNENNVEDVRKIFDTIKELKHKYKTCWILLHHTRKSYGYMKSKDDLRGSGDFAAFADIVLIVNKVKESMVRICQAKNRLQLPIPDFGVEIINTDDAGVLMEYREIERDEITKAERCSIIIEEWCREKKLDRFTTEEVEGAHSKDYKRNAIYDALKLLVIKGRLKKISRGEYEVNKDLLIKY